MKIRGLNSSFMLERLVLVLCFVFSSNYLMAQINLDINVSDKHLKKVEKLDNARTKLNRYKKYYSKDSVKAAKKEWKAYKKQYKDSLQQVGRWKELKAHKEEFMMGEWDFPAYKGYTIDTTLFTPPQDSLEWAVQMLAKEGSFGEIQDIYESYGQYDSAFLEQFTQLETSEETLEGLAERFEAKERVSQYLPEELRQESDFSIAEQMKYGELDEFGQLQQIDRSGVRDFFENINPEEFAKSQVEMQASKEKYAVLPDLSKEEEGIKRNSLQGTPLKKRIFLNGNVTVQSTDPIVLEGNIQLGYQWTKKLSTGVGLTYREQINDRDSLTDLTGDAHGWNAFVNYDIAKGFFAYSEVQQVINQPIFGESSEVKSVQYAYLIGLGRSFSLGKHVKLSVLMLYDLNHKNNELNRSPLVPRIGYSLSF